MPVVIFLGLLTLLGAFAGCSDPATCGIGTAPNMGLDAKAIADPLPHLTLTYGNLGGSPNNDCPASDAPSGVTSLTITGNGGDNLGHGTGLITLCIGRPDKLNDGLALGTDPETVQLIDLDGVDANACTYAIDRNVPITGTAQSDNLCSAGTDPAGFALTFDGTVSLVRTCSGVADSLAFTLSGTVAVAGP